MPKLVRVSRVLRNVMATLAERALLAAVRHVAESGPTWPDGRVRDREEPQVWNRMTMTNRRLTCRISSYRLELGCIRLTGAHPVIGYDIDEPWYDSEDNWHERSSDSSSPTWYYRKTGLQRW